MAHTFECRRCGTLIMWELDERTGKFCPVELDWGNPRHKCQIDINYIRARQLRDAKQAANQHIHDQESTQP